MSVEWGTYEEELAALDAGTVPGEPGVPGVPGTSGGGEVAGACTMETGAILDDVHAWLSRFITTMHPHDLDALALWTLHTHVTDATYTTPRLLLGSPVHGSGKTTVLDHLNRLCVWPVQAASLSSPALLTRMLTKGTRTILIDEVDRSLDPKNPGTGDLLAVLNSGYRKGASRPVLVPAKGGEWEAVEMPTYAPVAMAGNNPLLPEDTRSRCIHVLLMPDVQGVAEESDWELIEDEARILGERIATWAVGAIDLVRLSSPTLPDGIRGRLKECWKPLARVAAVCGGRWPEAVNVLAHNHLEQLERDKEDGLANEPPAVKVLRDMFEVWPEGEQFYPTVDAVRDLAAAFPDMWGEFSVKGKPLTATGLGRMLSRSFGLNSTRLGARSPRGYLRGPFGGPWRQMGVTPVTGTPQIKPGTPGTPGSPGTRGDTVFDIPNQVPPTQWEQDDICSDTPCAVCGEPLSEMREAYGHTHCIDCATSDVIAS